MSMKNIVYRERETLHHKTGKRKKDKVANQRVMRKRKEEAQRSIEVTVHGGGGLSGADH